MNHYGWAPYICTHAEWQLGWNKYDNNSLTRWLICTTKDGLWLAIYNFLSVASTPLIKWACYTDTSIKNSLELHPLLRLSELAILDWMKSITRTDSILPKQVVSRFFKRQYMNLHIHSSTPPPAPQIHFEKNWKNVIIENLTKNIPSCYQLWVIE